jgi:hypothetical protein
MRTTFWLENLKVRGNSNDLDENGKNIKINLWEKVGVCGLD